MLWLSMGYKRGFNFEVIRVLFSGLQALLGFILKKFLKIFQNFFRESDQVGVIRETLRYHQI